jgi:hypothetical protein
MRTAAWIYIVLSGVAIAFQLALVAGAPWGHLTMGGAYPGRLPANARAIAAGSAVLLAAFAATIAARASLAFPRWSNASRRLVWIVVAYSFIGILANAATPSAPERMLWLPIIATMAVCAILVARARHP